jgi:hypothetical protein
MTAISVISGNIRVFCRCRPLSKVETSSGYKCVVDFDGANDGDIGIMNGAKKTFKFDRVYTPKDDQGIPGYFGVVLCFVVSSTILTFRIMLITDCF